jgi:hypothetical protein
MKNFYLLFLLATVLSTAQRDRSQIMGTIVSSNNEILGGITVFNNASLEGTITNDKGVFLIDVKKGDRLDFRAVQFSNFNLVIGEETIGSKTLRISLREGVNELDEIRITNGSFMIPVKRVVEIDSGIDKVSERNLKLAANDRMENTFSERVRNPEEYVIRNEAFMQSQPRFNMVNLVGMLAALVIGTTLDAINVDGGNTLESSSEFDVVMLKNKFSTEYLTDFLEIEESSLYEFMYFAKDRGLDNSYFTPEKELELLQFLSETAVLYKEQKKQ